MSLIRTKKSEAFDTTVVAGSGRGEKRATPTPSRASSSDRWLGVEVDHFTIERPLGRGGMGVVYAATDRSLDREVAIKVLPDELLGDEDLTERFLREARAQAQLNSPNVVHIYYIGNLPLAPGSDGSPGEGGSTGALFFAMELVVGESLEAVLERGERLDPEEARVCLMEVARGLRDAHEKGIIHRDIKPGNLLRDARGGVKIADFGLAKPLRGDVKITQEGVVLGSPLYMAPEQARSEAVDHRADMYALGATFHHLLGGAPVFDGPTPLAVVAKHLTDPPPRLRERAPSTPPRLAAIVDRLLKKLPAERFATYDALLAALVEATPEATEYAGFFARGASLLVDCVVAGTIIALVGWPGLVIHIAYVTLMHAFFGQTLGKFLLRIQVRRVDGERLSVLRSLARTAVSMWLPILVGALILVTQGTGNLIKAIERLQPAELAALKSFLVAVAIGNALLTLLYAAGFVLAAFHPKKSALHDLLVGSQVVYRLTAKAGAPRR